MPGSALGRVAGHPLVRRLLSPAGLLLVALCFALPFVAVSCDTPIRASAQYTGADLVVGGAPTVSVAERGAAQQDDELADEPIDVQPAAVVALLAILAGILVAFLPGRRARVYGGVAAVAATVVLLAVNQILVQRELSREVERELGSDLPAGTSGGDFVEARYGFWLALSLASAVLLYQCFELYRLSRDLAGVLPKESDTG
jgi:hypothetical protein